MAVSQADRVMKSWAVQLTSFEDVPDIYQEPFQSLTQGAGDFPLTLLIPYPAPKSDQIITCVGDCIYILENTLSRYVDIKCHQLDQISMVKTTTDLLHAQLEVHSVGDQQQTLTTVIPYNAVSQKLLAPFILLMRTRKPGVTRPSDHELAKFKALGPEYLKFKNYARRSLLNEQTVGMFFMQKQIAKPILSKYFVRFYHTVVPLGLSMLTSDELIFIHEEVKPWWSFSSNYGMVCTYIPRIQIKSAGLRPAEHGDETLSLSLTISGENLNLTFDNTNRANLQKLYEQLTGA